MSMTIRADDVYLQYSKDQDPKKLFEKASSWFSTLQNTSLNSTQTDLVLKETHDAIIRAIFGSNMIERAGLGWDITVHLCRKILAGEDVKDIPERSIEYQSELLEMYSKQSNLKGMPAQYILRGRREIIQHARAFQYIIHTFVVEQQDLTEEVIKETHRILTKGVPIVQEGFPDIPAEDYSGIYRKVHVGAGSTMFTVPQFIPAKMRELCDNLKAELEEAKERNCIDPFSIASKYSMEFVQIHPFQDGNGRTCRMILNAILCRYAGIVIPIGEQGEEREEYINIKKRASETMDGHGEYATFVLARAVTRLRGLKKKLAGKAK
ncbi:fic/DOC family protein [Colletotrichum graminicola M1.001]|uniref:Fic/DOC family protein n=1 Tax=Colletotrichum graminicola (strain M1.001 / M2 / FGSC 10212) TaxID=645133 RepID=E3QQJ0_COLGM|nr:fic/DOC family protein [Colletotrichum graminicola M1.001]EFQ33128.1 fic/DOC family protein [Colletotrichum graminicola M1.001]